jgi:hypothetical protein
VITRTCIVVALLILPLPAPARAQSHFLKDNIAKAARKIGVHANVGFRHPIDADVSKGTSIGASIGLSPGETDGWKFPMAISLYRENLLAPGGDNFAVFRSISLLAGVGYGEHFGRLSASVALQAGYAINKGTLAGDAATKFAVDSVALDVGNAFVVRPRLNFEYELSRKFTLRASGDYVWSKPDIVVSAPGLRLQDRWDVSNLHANVGIGFYPFRK